jgi:hypothetical protein
MVNLPNPQDKADALTAYFEQAGGKTPRYYQQVAINKAGNNAVLGDKSASR